MSCHLSCMWQEQTFLKFISILAPQVGALFQCLCCMARCIYAELIYLDIHYQQDLTAGKLFHDGDMRAKYGGLISTISVSWLY